MTSETGERFQILSLDGGGIKSIFTTAVLARIEEDADVRIADHFDLITGTSTGGIIALGLGLGMRPREIVQFYVDEGPRIFKRSFGVGGFKHWLLRKYPAAPLRAALEGAVVDTLGHPQLVPHKPKVLLAVHL